MRSPSGGDAVLRLVADGQRSLALAGVRRSRMDDASAEAVEVLEQCQKVAEVRSMAEAIQREAQLREWVTDWRRRSPTP